MLEHGVFCTNANVIKVTAWLVYDDKKALPPAMNIPYLATAQDDTKFVPLDGQKALGPVTQTQV